VPLPNELPRLVDAASLLDASLLSPCGTQPVEAGGAVVAGDPSQGVIDARGQVFGYENLLITDGSALPANPGVNPSLTITALAEHTIAQVPPSAPPVTALRSASRPESRSKRGRGR